MDSYAEVPYWVPERKWIKYMGEWIGEETQYQIAQQNGLRVEPFHLRMERRKREAAEAENLLRKDTLKRLSVERDRSIMRNKERIREKRPAQSSPISCKPVRESRKSTTGKAISRMAPPLRPEKLISSVQQDTTSNNDRARKKRRALTTLAPNRVPYQSSQVPLSRIASGCKGRPIEIAGDVKIVKDVSGRLFAPLSKPSRLIQLSSSEMKSDLSTQYHFLVRPLQIRGDRPRLRVTDITKAFEAIKITVNALDIERLCGKGDEYRVEMDERDVYKIPDKDDSVLKYIDITGTISHMLIERLQWENAEPSMLFCHYSKLNNVNAELVSRLLHQCSSTISSASQIIKHIHRQKVGKHSALVVANLHWDQIVPNQTDKEDIERVKMPIEIPCLDAKMCNVRIQFDFFTCKVCNGESGYCLSKSGQCRYSK